MSIGNTTTYNWIAAYTNPRAEKKVLSHLEKNRITVYLPVIKKLKQWSDRKKWVEEPLFRSYIFVRISEKEYLSVLNTPGIVRYITFSGKAAVIPDHQIETLKRLLANEQDLELVDEKFSMGDKIEVTAGPLMGLTGELVEYQSKRKVLIRIDHIDQSILINISAAYLKAV